MYPNLDLKTFTLFTIPFDRCRNSLKQTFNHMYYPLFHSNMPQSPPQTSRGTLSKALSKDKGIQNEWPGRTDFLEH